MQQRPIPWFWIAIAALLLLGPGPAGRLLIDVLGGITLTLLLLPLVLAAVGWLGWSLLQRRLRTCQACGFTSLAAERCPACGTPFDAGVPEDREIDASDVIIDVQAIDVPGAEVSRSRATQSPPSASGGSRSG